MVKRGIIGWAKIGIAFIVIIIGSLYIWNKLTVEEAASIGIIGGADGPTAIFVTNKVTPTTMIGMGVWILGIIGGVLFIKNKQSKK